MSSTRSTRPRPSRRQASRPQASASRAPWLPGLVVSLALLACDEAGERIEERPISQVERGEGLFRSYCQRCHGERARGDGPEADDLAVRPTDLTRIAERNGGLFIPDAVAAYVDGRTLVEAHGSRDMPVWGRVLDDRNEATREELRLTSDMIGAIVAYLRTLQRTGDRSPE